MPKKRLLPNPTKEADRIFHSFGLEEFCSVPSDVFELRNCMRDILGRTLRGAAQRFKNSQRTRTPWTTEEIVNNLNGLAAQIENE